MNLLTLIPGRYKKASGHKGGEYHGPCPFCGDGGKGSASDRFHIWPEQGAHGTFWCRQCDKGGDAIAYLQQSEGLTFRAACERLGVQPEISERQGEAPARPSFVPAETVLPPAIWMEKAAAFADYCHARLRECREQLTWLSLVRGIDLAMIDKYRLGWNPSAMWRERTAWGLAPEFKENGKPKKLWLPRGLVIPMFAGGRILRVQIRQPEGSPRHFVLPGSCRQPLVSRRAEAYVVVESDLDAILLDGLAGDLAGMVAMGSSSTKPPADLFAELNQALHISVSLDSDAPRPNKMTGKMTSPGAKDSRWWLEQFPQAERVPIVGGKDPGEVFENGGDLRTWVLAGLPPRFCLPAGPLPVVEAAAAPAIEAEGQGPQPRIVTLLDGRELYVTDSQELWTRLIAAGKIAFSENELKRLQAACAGMSDEERTAAALQIVDTKEIFGAAWIRRGEVVA